jgi:hypothetical protein
MVKVPTYLQTKIATQVSTLMVFPTEKELTSGKVVPFTKVASSKA